MRVLGILCSLSLVVAAFLAASGVRAQSLAFDPGRVLAEVSGGEVRPYWTQDFGRAKKSGGYSALVPEGSAKTLLLKLRARLPQGYVAFVGTTRNLDDPAIRGVELVLARGHDQFDIVRLAATDGVNYGLTSEDIVLRLEKWDAAFGIDIWQAETDTVQMDLKSQPKDIRAFSRELYKFCPDIVDQGVGDLKSLQEEIREQEAITLWWD